MDFMVDKIFETLIFILIECHPVIMYSISPSEIINFIVVVCVQK